MQNLINKTVREIAVSMPVTISVFEKYKIDYCCCGERNFYDACELAGVAPEVISQKINQILSNQTSDAKSPEQLSVSELIDYILENHHEYARTEVERLESLLKKIINKHDKENETLISLQENFAELKEDLALHFRKEETVLFPFIKYLEVSAAKNNSMAHPPFKTVKNPIRAMMIEHDKTDGIMKKIRESTQNYTLPKNACRNFQMLYSGLKKLETNLYRHIHLENNVLFLNAVKLEQKVIFGY